MSATQVASSPRFFYITYPNFDPKNLVIKGTVINDLDNPPHFFEVIEGDKVRGAAEEQFGAGARDRGFVVRITTANNQIRILGFMIEVSQF